MENEKRKKGKRRTENVHEVGGEGMWEIRGKQRGNECENEDCKGKNGDRQTGRYVFSAAGSEQLT